jgi:integrase
MSLSLPDVLAALKVWLSRMLKRPGRSGTTVHGFRSTFSDWCAECTGFPSEVREMALAHMVGNAVKNAYRRRDMFAKRRALAEARAAYRAGGAEVIEFPAEVRPA